MRLMISCLLFLALLPGTAVQAEKILVGKTELEIPAPAGSVNVTLEIKDVSPYSQILTEAEQQGSKVFFYLPEKSAAVLRQGELPEPEHFFLLQIPQKVKDLSYSASDFAGFKMGIKKQNQQTRELIAKKVKKSMESLSQGISQDLDLDIALQVSGTVVLEPHDESINMLSWSMYITYGLQVEGEDVNEVNACTLTYLNAGGKLLVLADYATQDELEWTRTAARAWSDAILAANFQASPFPPALNRRGNSALGEQAVIVILIIMTVVVALAFLIKKRRSHSE